MKMKNPTSWLVPLLPLLLSCLIVYSRIVLRSWLARLTIIYCTTFVINFSETTHSQRQRIYSFPSVKECGRRLYQVLCHGILSTQTQRLLYMLSCFRLLIALLLPPHSINIYYEQRISLATWVYLPRTDSKEVTASVVFLRELPGICSKICFPGYLLTII